MTQILTADYVIVGAGATALAFADTMLSESEASMVIVDRRAAPGGHWNEAYPFVRLHGPSLNYGVNSRVLGSEQLEASGYNAGLYEMATGAEIRDYFNAVMNERLLPSGRVCYLPSHEYADGVARNIEGESSRLVATRKIVDTTLTGTQTPASTPPSFTIAEGVACIAPHALRDDQDLSVNFVLIGGGKTAMDTVVWLLTKGVAPSRISWIRPRDSWLLPRERVQPAYDFFSATMGGAVAEMECARDADSIDDLFKRVEAAGMLRRIDPNVTPTMYRCAITSAPELALLQQIKNVVRKGRVTAIRADRIQLEQGEIASPENVLFINCTADGNPRRSSRPIFNGDTISLQYVRRCAPCFSAAFIAWVETHLADDAEKNALCAPIPVPDEPTDWLRNHLIDGTNRYLWSKRADLQPWLANSRVDGFSGIGLRAMSDSDAEKHELLQRYRRAIGPAMERLAQLLETA